MKKILTIFVAIAMMITLVSCGNKQDSLAGKWVEDAESAEVLELFSDGTGILTTSDGNVYSLTSWIAENGRLKLTTQMPLIGESTFVFDYELKGKVLTVTVEGQSSTYTKEN